MKVKLELPKEFESHYNADKFDDSLSRVLYDISNTENALSGRYEREVIETLREVFKTSKVVKTGHWVYNKDGVDWGIPAWCCSECKSKNDMIPAYIQGRGRVRNPYVYAGSQFCPCCGVQMIEPTVS